VQFLGSNIIRVFEDSIIRLSFKEAELNLDKGAAAAILRNIGSLIKAMDQTFSVKSGTVVAGVRGTSFFVKREDPITTYFCLCNGRIDMGDQEGRFSQPMESSHHNAVRISETGGQMEVRKAPLLYHSDEGMEALAARIGQTIDWDRVEGYGKSY
jgi:ferric-dicitrate binding protein FerR (iron transport regulator)